MSDTEVKSFRIDISLGASLAVSSGGQLQNWVKPEVSSGMTWTGIPTEEEIRAAVEVITKSIVEPTLDEVIATAFAKIQGAAV